jgi:hypothetical protein
VRTSLVFLKNFRNFHIGANLRHVTTLSQAISYYTVPG